MEDERRKAGRPPAAPEEYRGREIKIRITAGEDEALDRYCKEHNVKKAGAAREALLAFLRAKGLMK